MNKKIHLKACGIGLSLLVAACGGLPQHAVTRTELVSLLVFNGGPENAAVMIDGNESGRLSGKQTRVAITDGAHDVTVQWQGHSIYSKTIFIEDGTQKIISLSN